ncbi:hypothetical protein N308_09771, partial [Struthio camelus australis]
VTRGMVASGATGNLWYSVVVCDFVVQVLCVVGRGVVVVVGWLAVVTARVVARVVVVVRGRVVVLTVGGGGAAVVIINFLTVLEWKFPLVSLLLHLPADLAFFYTGHPHRQGFHLRKGNSQL